MENVVLEGLQTFHMGRQGAELHGGCSIPPQPRMTMLYSRVCCKLELEQEYMLGSGATGRAVERLFWTGVAGGGTMAWICGS